MVNQSDQPSIATRQAYGETLVKLGKKYPKLIVMDAGMSNSTYSQLFKLKYPDRYFPMFIAEQNMVGIAVGLAKRGFVPFVSTFAAFLTRAHDQLRMASYSQANLKVCGSHCGVSIGQDGVSQMGLEDLAMFRSIYGSTVFYPADGVSTASLVELAYQTPGIVYIRTTRQSLPVIYDSKAKFAVGHVQIVKKSEADRVAVLASGITLHQALAAYEKLQKQGISIRVIDVYCLKPINQSVLLTALSGLKKIITVEDHYPEGGLGEAIRTALKPADYQMKSLSVNQLPKSGQPIELLAYEKIDQEAIIKTVRTLV